MMLRRSLSGYSMVEVVVAATVFLVAAAGVLGTITRTREPVVVSSKRLRAVLFARWVQEKLAADLAADTWDGPNWTVGAHAVPCQEVFFGTCAGVTANYTVAELNGGKTVTVDIGW